MNLENPFVLRHNLMRKEYFGLLLFIVICFADCRKYPEGPCVSFKSKYSRVEGDYNVQTFLIDGADSTSQLACNTCSFSYNKKTGKREINCCNGQNSNWDLVEEDKIIVTNIIYPNAGIKTPFPITKICCPVSNWTTNISDLRWEIQKLTNKEMWLKTAIKEREYYLKLKKY